MATCLGTFTNGDGAFTNDERGAVMGEVRPTSGWRRGTDDQLWVVTESGPAETVLAAWMPDGDGPRRVEQTVPTNALSAGLLGWREVEYDEVVRELCPAPESVAGILEGLPSPHERLREAAIEVEHKLAADSADEPQAVAELVGRGISVPAALRMVRTGEDETTSVASVTRLWQGVIEARNGLPAAAHRAVLRDVLAEFPSVSPNQDGIAFLAAELDERLAPRGELRELPRTGVSKTRAEVDQLREELLSTVPPLLTRAGQLAGTLARVLQDASDYLDEAYGPTFTAWRCDHCAQLVTDDQLEFGWDPGPSMHAIYKPAGEGVGRRQVLAYVECLESTVDGIHGPMRHVVCRVTPESPDPLDGVASREATEEVQTG